MSRIDDAVALELHPHTIRAGAWKDGVFDALESEAVARAERQAIADVVKQ